MVFGIAGGLIMCGLIAGALSGSIWLMLSFVIAGFIVAGIAEAIKLHKEKATTSCQLAHYPPYGY